MTIFDHLIAGALPASFVHQDERCVAFMDISPITPGHVLVVPRQSVATLDALDAEARAHLWEVARKVGVAQRQALGSVAQHLLVNDGPGASQSVPHVHIHVIPRYGGDTLRTVTSACWRRGGGRARRAASSCRRWRSASRLPWPEGCAVHTAPELRRMSPLSPYD